MPNLLEKINSPDDIKKLSPREIESLAREVREFITESVSVTGGHLASNLGIVELTLAMHYVFDFKNDKLLWDVGHQCYTHKIITGRKELFAKLRTREGISGFPNPDESPYDQFTVGHAGTAVATAMGMALGEKQMNLNDKIVALVGDASIVNGLSVEALNNMGLVKRQLLIVLNDNSMAIDATQGALAKYLSRARLSHTYEDMRKTANQFLERFPMGKNVEDAIESFKKTVRMSTIAASRSFESLNIPYFGPIDGHDIGTMIELFGELAKLDHPAILHVYTKKGKGFTPADNDPSKFHSTGPFKIDGESASVPASARSFTDAFGDTLVGLAQKDNRIVAITAAMCDATGLGKFREKFPQRFYDVGIAESVAVDIAAGLAKTGAKPFVCIYSTFLQRSFDEIFQEVALQNLPVIFCIDRAGFVGGDGATHHGLLDIGFMRMLPNMVVIAPANETEMKLALEFAVKCNSPVAIRYPRDVVKSDTDPAQCSERFELGKSVAIQEANADIVLVSYGAMLGETVKAAKMLEAGGIKTDIINARFAKPIDPKLVALAQSGKTIITIEDHSITCGFGSALLEATASTQNSKLKIQNLGAPDRFIMQDTRQNQFAESGVSAEKIAEVVINSNTMNVKGCSQC
jgi:1-deoxy-D-xylulose-5-phosphate synthase